MANVNELQGWTPGVRQFETTDPIEGGADGVDNIALSQLASRTRYLYDMMNAMFAPFLGTNGINGKGWMLFNDILANIPTGWAEVTEMRGRTPVGMSATPYNSVNPATDATFGAIGNTGGAKKTKLTELQIPELTIRATQTSGEATGGGNVVTGNTPLEGPLADTKLRAGLTTPNDLDLMNPYRVVTFIKWVGIGNGTND